MKVSTMNATQRGMFDAAVAAVTAMKRAADEMPYGDERSTLNRYRRQYTREAAEQAGCESWDIWEAAKTRVKHGE